ncbi:helix-turn-helix transcriptional regulator [Streptomyces tremellae]|uniref:HTH cro/C1-type domain-containing protein n=1 Tax=Streptomyces tremellae TaxID=1124239 RepID=A0ABP7E374_9ACTN
MPELFDVVDALIEDHAPLPPPAGRKRLREAHGLSQEQVAKALRVRRTTVMSWENGRTEPRSWCSPRPRRPASAACPPSSRTWPPCACPSPVPRSRRSAAPAGGSPGAASAPGSASAGRRRAADAAASSSRCSPGTRSIPAPGAARQASRPPEQQLRDIAAEGLQEVCFRHNGRRADGLLVGFTDIDYLELDY